MTVFLIDLDSMQKLAQLIALPNNQTGSNPSIFLDGSLSLPGATGPMPDPTVPVAQDLDMLNDRLDDLSYLMTFPTGLHNWSALDPQNPNIGILGGVNGSSDSLPATSGTPLEATMPDWSKDTPLDSKITDSDLFDFSEPIRSPSPATKLDDAEVDEFFNPVF